MVSAGARARVIALAVMTGLGLSACVNAGPSTESTDSTHTATEPPDGQWVTHELGPLASESDIQAATVGDEVSILTVEGDNRVRAFRVDDDLALKEVTYDGNTAQLRRLTAMSDGPAGLVAMGTDLLPDGRNVLLSSPDGDVWSEPTTTGLDQPMDVSAMVATSSRYVAVGMLRTVPEPATGGFRPGILTSTDGTSWVPAAVPERDDGSVTDVVEDGSGLLAMATLDGRTEAWRSSDDGATWSLAPEVPGGRQVAHAGGSTLTPTSIDDDDTGKPVDLVLHRSTDGVSWAAVDTAFHEGYGLATIEGDDGGFSLLTAQAYRDAFDSPEVCYADLQRCGPRASVDDEAVFVSDTGESWRELDLNVLNGLRTPSAVLHTPAGDTVVLGQTETEKSAVWVWDSAQGEPPSRPAAAQPMPTYDGPPFADRGMDLEEGKTYAFPLYIHCGGDFLAEFNGTSWGLSQAPAGHTPETGGVGVREGWPVAGQSILGFVTLVARDRIEYSLEDGTVIAVYEPIPESEVLGCD